MHIINCLVNAANMFRGISNIHRSDEVRDHTQTISMGKHVSACITMVSVIDPVTQRNTTCTLNIMFSVWHLNYIQRNICPTCVWWLFVLYTQSISDAVMLHGNTQTTPTRNRACTCMPHDTFMRLGILLHLKTLVCATQWCSTVTCKPPQPETVRVHACPMTHLWD